MSSKTLRLVFPEWQGGAPAALDTLVNEVTPPCNLLGYAMGSRIIQMIAPKLTGPEVVVPVSMSTDPSSLQDENGIFARRVLLSEVKECVKIIKEQNPERIITIGGECSASVPPFSYLSQKYNNDVAIIWIDAHPDIGQPGDDDHGYNSMALAHILGHGDKEFLDSLPGSYQSGHVMYLGIRSIDSTQQQRIKSWGLNMTTPEEFRNNPQIIVDWLRSTKCSKVMIHLDLDVIDPEEIILAVGLTPKGMLLSEVTEALNLIDSSFDIVGFTVAEHMPRVEMRLSLFLSQLNVFKK